MKEATKIVKNSGQFQKGGKKPEGSGRKKGTPNKRTAEIQERLKGVDIVGELLEIARTTEKEETKVAVYKELLKYCYPQLKAVDMDMGNSNVNIQKIFITPQEKASTDKHIDEVINGDNNGR